MYIITNKWNNVLYTGVTGDLMQRVQQHKDKAIRGFTQRYNLDKLVYFEMTENVEGAILREKQIKGGSRNDEIELVNSMNAGWRDLFNEL